MLYVNTCFSGRPICDLGGLTISTVALLLLQVLRGKLLVTTICLLHRKDNEGAVGRAVAACELTQHWLPVAFF